MKFVKLQDFHMYHDVDHGVSAGWRVTFTIHYPINRPTRVSVMAKSPSGRVIRSPKQVSQIMDPQDWPEFARKLIDQKVNENHDERLF